MLSIDNSDVLNYPDLTKNVLTASLSFSYSNASEYTSAPTVAFSGGAGTGAAGTAVITNGVVTGITITAGGSGYTSAPTIALTGGGGTGATATAIIASGAVTGATITNPGTGQAITITDNSTYVSPDAREKVNILAADRFGNKYETSIGASPAYAVIYLGPAGLNRVDGIDLAATVVSAEGRVKDGSVHDVTTLKSTGNFVMEK